MKIFDDFSQKLRLYRTDRNESISQVASSIGVDRTYLSKLENGHERPSIEVLNSLIRHYSLSEEEVNDLFFLAGYRGGAVFTVPNRKEENMENTPKQPENQNRSGIQVNVNKDLPVLYSDSVWVTSSPYGILLDFAVSLGPTNQQNVIARVGMSKEHAKALVETILRQINTPAPKVPVNTLKN